MTQRDTDTVSSAPPPKIAEWVRQVTDATRLTIERRSGGASRAGFAVTADFADGSERRLWLRMDTGSSPLSRTAYTLHREAAIYRALQDSPVRVAKIVAVHPTEEAFLMERVEGATWFSEIRDTATQVELARAFMAQLAALHRLDVRSLSLPEVGEPTSVTQHVRAQIDFWEEQYRQGERDQDLLIELALVWLRRNLPGDDDWPVVLVQGDTGPGNFMYKGNEITAITDWEVAHLGDIHEDLGWIYVRDLQERFTYLPDRLRDYERFSGFEVDPGRLRYFRVLAQWECAVGTSTGLRATGEDGEVGSLLIFNALHMRMLSEAMAEAVGMPTESPEMCNAEDSESTWLFDVALKDLRNVIVPHLEDGFALRRAKGLARVLKYLREVERMGSAVRAEETKELNSLVDGSSSDLAEARRNACAALIGGRLDGDAVLRTCLQQQARLTGMMRPALGALADRHYSPIAG